MTWSAARRRKTYQRQRLAWEAVQLAELDFIDEQSLILDATVQTPYMFSACRVVDFDGEPVLTVFCEPMV